MKLTKINADSVLVKSKLPASDYVANPYTGCTHDCKYCYASFMKRFTGHSEDWGTFVDIKEYSSTKLPKNLENKTVLLSSVTDPYQGIEGNFHKSREILKLLGNTGANVEILTKSDLVIKDIDVFKDMKNLKVGISLCTLDDGFRKIIEPNAPSVQRRLNALESLHMNGISTYLFISPIFPYITDISAIVRAAGGIADKICFENLNLRGKTKTLVLDLIKQYYPQYYEEYKNIYLKKDNLYWENLEKEIEIMSETSKIPFVNYFYHSKIKKGGKKND